ncbi:hypothetical protein C8F04DRAFT_1253508 [Mycena alexandri]|uniref:F-box domain-containing protein n=1 Tax=Mycena alexandri TaxID=1745969 RepID=A0AAD6T9M3_9AGAR|nr:hypothetical protein C8F04DRAFT_1253508 [Mycena alexandri]
MQNPVVPASSSYTPVLPLEVLSLIFFHFGTFYDPTLLVFRWACCSVSLVSRLWRSVANSEPSFWRTINVGPSTSMDHLAAFLVYSANRSIAVSFSVFKAGRVNWKEVRPLLLASATFLLPSVHRWVALELFVDDIPTHDALVELLSPAPSPRPSLLFLACSCYAFDLNPIGRLFFPKSPVLGGLFHSLRYLLFSHVAVPWSTLPPMPRLLHLSMHSCSWPNASRFLDFLQASPDLRTLSLSGVGFTGVVPTRVVILPALVRLRVSFKSGHLFAPPTLLSILSCMGFPMLADLTLKFVGASSVHDFLDTSLSFRSPLVRLEGVCGRVDRMASIYSRLSDVSSLDLRRADPDMLLALRLPGSTPNVAVLHRLTTLLLYSPSWAPLLSTLDARRALGASRLSLLQCDHPLRLPLPAFESDYPYITLVDLRSYFRVLDSVSVFTWASRDERLHSLAISTFFT